MEGKSKGPDCRTLIVFTLFRAFPPQWLFFKLFQGRSAALNAVFLVLGEAAAITAILFEIFFVDETQVDMFDAVLINEGFSNLVAQGRHLLNDPADNSRANGQRVGAKTNGNPVQVLGKHKASATYSPFSIRQIVEFVLFLPLNFIPYVGVPIFLILTGHRAGPLHHHRYFRLKGFDKKHKRQFVTARNLQYTWFGTVGLVLQLVPVLSMAFLCTTTVGSALLAIRLEEQQRLREESSQDRRDQRQHETYTDDPAEKPCALV